MVRAKNGPISRQIVEVVHDDGHEQVQNEEGADNEEGDKVGEGKVGATTLFAVGVVRVGVALNCGVFDARKHDLLPGFSSSWAKEYKKRLGERLEVVVPGDGRVPLINSDFSEYLWLMKPTLYW